MDIHLDWLTFLGKPHLDCIFRKPACCDQREASRWTSPHFQDIPGRGRWTNLSFLYVCATTVRGRDGGFCFSFSGVYSASYALAACGYIFALGLHGKVLVAGVGPYRVCSCEKLLEASRLSDRANARWLQDRPLAKAKPISNGGSTFGITYKEGKKPKTPCSNN